LQFSKSTAAHSNLNCFLAKPCDEAEQRLSSTFPSCAIFLSFIFSNKPTTDSQSLIPPSQRHSQIIANGQSLIDIATSNMADSRTASPGAPRPDPEVILQEDVGISRVLPHLAMYFDGSDIDTDGWEFDDHHYAAHVCPDHQMPVAITTAETHAYVVASLIRPEKLETVAFTPLNQLGFAGKRNHICQTLPKSYPIGSTRGATMVKCLTCNRQPMQHVHQMHLLPCGHWLCRGCLVAIAYTGIAKLDSAELKKGVNDLVNFFFDRCSDRYSATIEHMERALINFWDCVGWVCCNKLIQFGRIMKADGKPCIGNDLYFALQVAYNDVMFEIQERGRKLAVFQNAVWASYNYQVEFAPLQVVSRSLLAELEAALGANAGRPEGVVSPSGTPLSWSETTQCDFITDINPASSINCVVGRVRVPDYFRRVEEQIAKREFDELVRPLKTCAKVAICSSDQEGPDDDSGICLKTVENIGVKHHSNHMHLEKLPLLYSLDRVCYNPVFGQPASDAGAGTDDEEPDIEQKLCSHIVQDIESIIGETGSSINIRSVEVHGHHEAEMGFSDTETVLEISEDAFASTFGEKFGQTGTQTLDTGFKTEMHDLHPYDQIDLAAAIAPFQLPSGQSDSSLDTLITNFSLEVRDTDFPTSPESRSTSMLSIGEGGISSSGGAALSSGGAALSAMLMQSHDDHWDEDEEENDSTESDTKGDADDEYSSADEFSDDNAGKSSEDEASWE
jgi:hypothetical protein